MAFDFPSTPSIGDLFQDSSSGAVYRWNGYAWVGGVTGIGLQTVKETRYLVAGSYTFTRDPKSSGFADIHLMGPMGGALVSPWVSGQVCNRGGGAGGTIGIKWKYALPASAPVVVGASSGTGAGNASSFDTVLTAPGGGPGQISTAASAATQTASAGTIGGPATGCDESYLGSAGATSVVLSGTWAGGLSPPAFFRGIMRKAVNPNASGVATLPAAPGDPGAVFVVEYLNP